MSEASFRMTSIKVELVLVSQVLLFIRFCKPKISQKSKSLFIT